MRRNDDAVEAVPVTDRIIEWLLPILKWLMPTRSMRFLVGLMLLAMMIAVAIPIAIPRQARSANRE